MKKKNIIILVVVLIVLLLGIFGYFRYKDSFKFSNEYGVNKFNNFSYSSLSDVFDMVNDKKSGVVFLCYSGNSWCKEYAKVLNDASLDNGAKVYYVDIKNDMDNKSDSYNKLIDLLENTFKKNSYKDDFKALINHFNQECFFCGKLGTKSDHKTFKRKNGTDYYEYHHFIQQHKGKKLLELKNIIDAPENKICLCSNCHNKIHYGKIDEVNNMIDLIWNDEKIQNMLDMYQFSSIIGEDTLSWIKDVYISNSEFSKKNNDNVG